MADYATRAKAIIANIKNKDQTVPDNTFLFDIAYAYVYLYRQQWQTFLRSSDNQITDNVAPNQTVINPANLSDPTDIGVLNTDTAVFTPSTNGEKNKLYAQHFIL